MTEALREFPFEYRVVYDNGNCSSGFADSKSAWRLARQYRNARVERRTTWEPVECAACAGDPEAHDLHVCGKEPFA